MKVIPERYMCEICWCTYNHKKLALECEARGRVEYPVGCIYGNHTPTAMYSNMTFAVADNSFNGHMNIGCSWACRDTGAGDSRSEEDVCSSGHIRLTKGDGKVDEKHPTFIRMVAWLQDRKIPVTVWDGKKAVPYDEYMELEI